MAALQTAPSPSPQALWMALILSTDLQMPLHDQSKDAAHTFPACFFHSQSAHTTPPGGRSQNQQLLPHPGRHICKGSLHYVRTWWRGAAEAPVVDVLDLQPEEPRAERHVLVGEPVQDRPAA